MAVSLPTGRFGLLPRRVLDRCLLPLTSSLIYWMRRETIRQTRLHHTPSSTKGNLVRIHPIFPHPPLLCLLPPPLLRLLSPSLPSSALTLPSSVCSHPPLILLLSPSPTIYAGAKQLDWESRQEHWLKGGNRKRGGKSFQSNRSVKKPRHK